MTLAFSQIINLTPTFFPYKILNGLVNEELIKVSEYRNCIRAIYTANDIIKFVGKDKIHTIRPDEKNRWKDSNNIHFVINNRTPQRYQFAPTVMCMSIQNISIKHWHNKIGTFFDVPLVLIDDRPLYQDEVNTLAINDGFECADDFYAYFNEDFEGKIIHWTSCKY